METDLFDSLDPLTNTSFLSLDCEALRNLLFPLQPQTLPKLETKQLSTRVSTQKRKAGTRQDTASALRGGQASAVRSGLPAAKRRKCHAVSEGRASPNQRSKTKHEAVDRSSEFDVKTHHVVGNGKVSVQAWTSSKDAKVWAAHCVVCYLAADVIRAGCGPKGLKRTSAILHYSSELSSPDDFFDIHRRHPTRNRLERVSVLTPSGVTKIVAKGRLRQWPHIAQLETWVATATA